MARRSQDGPILWLVRQPQGLIPATPFDMEQIERYRIGSHLKATITQPKDDKTLRFWQAMTAKVATAVGVTHRSMKNRLLLECGFFDGIEHFDGATVFTVMNVADMGQDELQDLVDRAAEIIVTKILPGTSIDDLMEMTGEHLGEPSL